MSKPLVLLPETIEPLVLIPGMMCDARVFGPQIKVLGKSRAIHLAAITNHETIEDLAAEVLSAAPNRFALAGLSMGGMVALEVLRQAPDRVIRLALMDTTAHSETPQVAASREPQIVKVMAGKLEEVMREERVPLYFPQAGRRDDLAEIVVQMAKELGDGVFMRQCRALQKRGDYQDDLSKITVPTLVLCGDHDEIFSAKRHETMADLIPGSVLEVAQDAGHLPTLEAPDFVTDALEKWLAR